MVLPCCSSLGPRALLSPLSSPSAEILSYLPVTSPTERLLYTLQQERYLPYSSVQLDLQLHLHRGRRGTLPPSGLDTSTPAAWPESLGPSRRNRDQAASVFVKLLWTNVQHSTTSFVNLTLNNSWQANGIFFPLRNEEKCK